MQAKEYMITGVVSAFIATIFNNLLGGSLINFSLQTIYVVITTIVIGAGIGFLVFYLVNLRSEEQRIKKAVQKSSKR
ncbi:MAG: hypothetical protein ACTSUW_05390 [Candidatus Heimdallarchaeota archaeon]